jgi:two-component system cell cycle sensor histidine kinase/response regulator CckA
MGEKRHMTERQLGRTVLLVDDEESVRLYITTVLRREGFQVLEAADGVDAFALLREIRGAVDVLVTDIRMPRMSGTELVEAIKVDFPGIPVVYISGDHSRQDVPNGHRRVAFLQKPFAPQAIVDAIRGVVLNTTTASEFVAPRPPNGQFA